MKNPVSFEQLQRFVATAELGGISLAARLLKVSQATVTVSVAGLEKSLGQKLFLRDHTGVHLTPAGHELLPKAKDIVARMENAIRDLKTFRNPGKVRSTKSVVRLGIIPQVSQVLLVPLMESRVHGHPDIDLIVKEDAAEEIGQSLETGELDLVISNKMPSGKGIHAKRIVAQEFHLIGTTDTLPTNGKPIRFAELARYPLTQGLMRRDVLQKLADEKSVPLNFDFNSPVTLRKQLIQSVGSCTVSLYYLYLTEILAKELSACPIREPRLVQFLYLLRRSASPPTAAERHMRRLIKSQVDRLIGQAHYRWRRPDRRRTAHSIELDAL
jgi:DNA-binding transcriptional LysR family regulator